MQRANSFCRSLILFPTDLSKIRSFKIRQTPFQNCINSSINGLRGSNIWKGSVGFLGSLGRKRGEEEKERLACIKLKLFRFRTHTFGKFGVKTHWVIMADFCMQYSRLMQVRVSFNQDRNRASFFSNPINSNGKNRFSVGLSGGSG